MWQTDEPVVYPTDPSTVMWNYEQGNRRARDSIDRSLFVYFYLVRDESMQDVANYYARLLSWCILNCLYDNSSNSPGIRKEALLTSLVFSTLLATRTTSLIGRSSMRSRRSTACLLRCDWSIFTLEINAFIISSNAVLHCNL